jgi:type I site-specific restriction-modification system R (restriction) subunit
LIQEKNYPISLINVEKVILINGLKKRYDIVVFNPDGSLAVVVECKAPKVQISQSVFDQIARYNLTLKASCLMVTNGLNHYFCTMNHHLESFEFLETLPNYNNK